MVTLVLAVLSLWGPAGSSVQGTVRSSESGGPISDVLVEVVDRGRVTRTDSAGRYAITDLSSGVHVLRVSRVGYDPRTAEVFVARDSVLRVDILLAPRPVRLDKVRVEDKRPNVNAGTDGSAPQFIGRSDVEARRFSGRNLHANPAFGDADVLQTLSILPDVATRPEFPTSLHVRGGSGDQNLILVDGVPIYNAYHAAGALTALNPDVVSEVRVSSGVPSARHGGALSSVVSIETMGARDDARVRSWSTLGSRSVGQTVDGPLFGGAGAFVVSGRRSTRDIFPGLANQTSSAATFGDLFAKGTLRAGHNELELFSLTSADRLAFDARLDATGADAGGGAVAGNGLDGFGTVTSAPPQNGFGWHTATQAIVWHHRSESPVELSARAWRTRFDAGADWSAAAGPVHLASALTHDGISADATRRLASNIMSTGLSGERVHTEYALRRAVAGDPGATVLPVLTVSRLMVSAFVEDEWHFAPHWAFTGGLRELLGAGQWRDADPRATLRFSPRPGFALSAGYARTHQYVQSLRNEESVLDGVVGIGFPVAARAGGAPVARSDDISLAADARVSQSATVTIGAYARRMDGLLLVAPVTAQPFAMDGFSRGSGRASGVTALLDWRGERVYGHAAYALGRANRAATGLWYQPSFASSQSFNMAIGFRPTPSTVLRAALWSSAGRPASIVNGDLQWSPHNLLSGADDMAGTPERIIGPLNAERLPFYARVDLGIRHQWHLGMLGHSADLTGVANLANALDRANMFAPVLSTDGHTRRNIPMTPRSLTLGFEWSF